MCQRRRAVDDTEVREGEGKERERLTVIQWADGPSIYIEIRVNFYDSDA